MPLDEGQLKKILLDSELLSQEQIDSATGDAKSARLPFTEVLLKNEYISDEHLGEVIADLFGLPFVRLQNIKIDDNVLRLIPEIVARNQSVIAYQWDASGISLAMSDPENIEIQELITKRLGAPVHVVYATPEDISQTLFHYRKELEEEFSTMLQQNISRAAGAQAKDPPIIKLVDMLIKYAYENRASDIHLEPHDCGLAVRYRIDGVLHDVTMLPKEIEAPIVSRIKILSSLRTDEHMSAQDGRFQKKFENEKVDVRVSIVPISEGEKVVMRLLSQGNRRFNLEELGLSPHDLSIIKRNTKRPHGMILATGPTGSGKTTTLYAILKVLNTRKVNISTIEDPVEYDIEGINQIQVNPATNLTFAQGLRSILRQDPDVIMVGEIRDNETAGIAINSAMTGHVVLSSLHTNDATTTLPRLIDMGIEPFLISSTVNIALGQRLVRRIHPRCIESYKPTDDEFGQITGLFDEQGRQKFEKQRKGIRLYRGKGCDLCHGTGYEGRLGIFEVLEINEDIRKMIMQRANSEEIRKVAVEQGMTTMFNDGIQKALKGMTTIEEILRVTRG